MAQEMKKENILEPQVKIEVAVRNLFCYLCHQEFPDSTSFQSHNHHQFFTHPNNNNNNNLSTNENTNLNANPSKRKTTRRCFRPDSSDFLSFDDEDTEQFPKRARRKKKPRSTAKKNQVSSRVKTKMKSYSTKENVPVQNKNKNNNKKKDNSAVEIFLAKMGDFFHCTLCFDTFHKLRDLIVHFKKCDSSQSSSTSFKQFKIGQQSKCDSETEKNPEILNESKSKNNNNDNYEIIKESPPLIEIIDDDEDQEEEEEEENIDSESDSSFDLNPDSDSEMSETGFSHLSSPPPNLNEETEGENTEQDNEEGEGESLLFSCPDCSMGFTKKRYMLDHQRRIHRARTHTCPLCSYATYFRHILFSHIKFHHPGHPILQQPQFHTVRCLHPNCHNTFPSRAQMKKCQHGNETDSNLNEGNPQSSSSSSLLCFECGKTLSSVYTFQKHVASHRGSKPYKCRQADCEKSYVSRAHWIEHEKTHDTEFKCPHSNGNGNGNGNESNNCDNLIFTSQAELNLHLNSVHPQNIVCGICGLSSTSTHKHYQHSLKHKEKTHSCSECGQKFRRLEHLRRHLASAKHGERTKIRFACEIPGCWKEYARAENLQEHMNIFHAGNQKYICELCGRGDFLNSTSFTKHRKTHVQNQNQNDQQEQQLNPELTQE